MDLTTQLQYQRIQVLAEQAAPVSVTEHLAIDHLRTTSAKSRALRVGERAPGFRLADSNGLLVSLEELIADGPAVILFFRGLWCPFCRLTLQSYAEHANRFAALRVSLIAISPQRAFTERTPATASAPTLRWLSDKGSHVARAWGLANDLPHWLSALYEGEYDISLPEINDDESWTLPVPATYIIEADGTVANADVQVDYRYRQSPEAVLIHLNRLFTRAMQSV